MGSSWQHVQQAVCTVVVVPSPGCLCALIAAPDRACRLPLLEQVGETTQRMSRLERDTTNYWIAGESHCAACTWRRRRHICLQALHKLAYAGAVARVASPLQLNSTCQGSCHW